MAEIFKFPYDACRRVHSKKPRRSKNGTPEERAAKAAKPTNAAVIPLGKMLEQKSAEEGEHSLSSFLRFLRQYFEQERSISPLSSERRCLPLVAGSWLRATATSASAFRERVVTKRTPPLWACLNSWRAITRTRTKNRYSSATGRRSSPIPN